MSDRSSPPSPHTQRLIVEIETDGTAPGSSAIVTRKLNHGAASIEGISPGMVERASCAVRRYPDGTRLITASVWVR